MAVNWGLLQPQNTAGHVMQGFERGREIGRQNNERGAIQALMGDPGNMDALQQLAGANAPMAMQFQQHHQRQQQSEQEAALAAIERNRQHIIRAGQLIREINPQDQAGWDRARQAAAQMQIPLDGVPEQFDPQYRDNILSIANVYAPPNAGQPGALQKNAEYYRSIGRDDLAEEYLERNAEGPPMFIDVQETPGGPIIRQQVRAPRSNRGTTRPPAPGTVEDGYRFKGGNPADPSSWEPVEGGAGQQGPRTFP